MRVRKTFWVLLILLLISYLAGKQLEYFLLDRLIYTILVVILIAWFWARTSLNGLIFNRLARSFRKETGEIFEERFRIENNSRYLKSWIEIVDHSQLPGNHGSRIMAWVGKNELRNYSAYTMLKQRGKYNLFPTIVKSGDPFGLFEIEKQITTQQTLIVIPHHDKIFSFPLPAGYLPGGKSIRKKTTAITPHAAGIREHLPGDSLNRIHWKKTAQRGILISKEFEEDPQSDVWIIVDSQISAHSTTKQAEDENENNPLWSFKQKGTYKIPQSSFEYAVSIAATLADYFIRKGQGVGFHSYGKTSTILPPEKGYRQYQKIVETLAFVQADGDCSIETGVTGHVQQILPGSLVILIGTELSDGIVPAAEYFKLRRIAPFVIILDNNTFLSDINNIPHIEFELEHIGIANKVIKFGDLLPDKLQN
jgi:uncharacterized protein (DUF58 family)